MKDFIGVEEINAIINEFLEPFGIVAKMGNDMAFYPAKDLIVYSPMIPEDGLDYFMQTFHRLAPDLVGYDSLLVSILHEVGHSETLDSLDEDEEFYCLKMKSIISIQSDISGHTKELHQTYFDLPDEYEATMWAAEYLREHAAEANAFWSKLKPALLKFYEMNGVKVND